MTTDADKNLNSAAEHIKEAIRNLNAIVVDECWGHDEYKGEYRQGIYQSLHDLIEIKTRLDR
jgi:hypothetical protein